MSSNPPAIKTQSSQDPFRHGVIVSWHDPAKIEKQSIVDALVGARRFASGRLIDVGCGGKPYVDIFASQVTQHLGIDFQTTSAGNSAADIYADSMMLPFQSGSFDTALSTQVLEHVLKPKSALREINRVLKPGGYLILTAPQTWGLHEEPHDYYRFTSYGLRYLAEINGFQVEYIKARGGLFALIGQLLINGYYQRRTWTRSSVLRRWLGILLVWIFARLDRIFPAREDTLGYVLVASKRQL